MSKDLLALKIPSGWYIEYNVLTNNFVRKASENVKVRGNKNLLFMSHGFTKRILELKLKAAKGYAAEH